MYMQLLCSLWRPYQAHAGYSYVFSFNEVVRRITAIRSVV